MWLNIPDSGKLDGDVLVVEDCPLIAIAIQGLLLQFNLSSEHCLTADEAIERVKFRLSSSNAFY